MKLDEMNTLQEAQENKITELNTLSPYQRAAQLLIALDQSYSLDVLHLLNKDEVQHIFHWLDQDHPLPQKEIEVLVTDFYTFLNGQNGKKSHDEQKKPNQAAQEVSPIVKPANVQTPSIKPSPENKLLNELKNASDKDLQIIIEKEEICEIALTLSYLTPKRILEILYHLPWTAQVDLLYQIILLENYESSLVKSMEQNLEEKWGKLPARKDNTPRGGVFFVSDILLQSDSKFRTQIIVGIQHLDPTVGSQLEDMLAILEV